jgi:CRP-like cAMP-binding protein
MQSSELTPQRYDVRLLQNVPLFRGLSDAERREIADRAHLVHFQPGEYVLREGETRQRLWIILAGQCEVLRHGAQPDQPPVLLAVLDPYDNFGEMSFFDRAAHAASIRAATALELLCLEREAFDALFNNGSQAASKLVQNVAATMARRLRHMDAWVTRLLRSETHAPRVKEWENFRQQLFQGWKS